MKFNNRVTEMLGVELPIVQAPMGWIARSVLASAVSNAGGMGIIETSSGELDIIKEEIKRSIVFQGQFRAYGLIMVRHDTLTAARTISDSERHAFPLPKSL